MRFVRWLFVALLVIAPAANAATFEELDQGVAYSNCMAAWASIQSYKGPEGTSKIDPNNYRNHICTHDAAARTYRCTATQVGDPSGGFQTVRACQSIAGSADYWRYPADGKCDSRDTQVNGWAVDEDPNTSNDVCDSGCMMTYSFVVGAGGALQNTWSPSGATCSESDAPPPAPDADNDGTPDDQDAFPNDPNEDTDTDGDGIGDNADHAPDDAEDGADDGEGDESDNEAHGGGDCRTPPTCTGDGIACASLKQQWHTRCLVEGHGQKVENGDCSATQALKCTGLTVQQCYDLAYQKKQACAEAGEGGDDQPEWTKVQGDGSGTGGEDPDPESVVHEGIGLNPENLLDDGGFWGGSASCPTLGTLNLPLYGTFNLDQFDFLCDLLAAIRAFLLLLGAFMALRILMGG